MPRPVHFEIHADDLDRGQAFYEQLFGWTFQTFGDGAYRLITTGSDSQPGINGGMLRRMGEADHAALNPVISYMCTIDVDDVDAYRAKALALGGSEALPKMAIPGTGWLVYVKDTEGNIFGMMQNDPEAA